MSDICLSLFWVLMMMINVAMPHDSNIKKNYDKLKMYLDLKEKLERM